MQSRKRESVFVSRVFPSQSFCALNNTKTIAAPVHMNRATFKLNERCMHLSINPGIISGRFWKCLSLT